MEIRKSVIKSLENELFRNNWEGTPYNILGMQYITHVLKIACMGHASVITCFSHPHLEHYLLIQSYYSWNFSKLQ